MMKTLVTYKTSVSCGNKSYMVYRHSDGKFWTGKGWDHSTVYAKDFHDLLNLYRCMRVLEQDRRSL